MKIKVIRQQPNGAAVIEDTVLIAETPPFDEGDTMLVKVEFAPGRSVWVDSEGNLWVERRWTSALDGAHRRLLSVNSALGNTFLEADAYQDGAPDAGDAERAMTRIAERTRNILSILEHTR